MGDGSGRLEISSGAGLVGDGAENFLERVQPQNARAEIGDIRRNPALHRGAW